MRRDFDRQPERVFFKKVSLRFSRDCLSNEVSLGSVLSLDRRGNRDGEIADGRAGAIDGRPNMLGKDDHAELAADLVLEERVQRGVVPAQALGSLHLGVALD